MYMYMYIHTLSSDRNNKQLLRAVQCLFGYTMRIMQNTDQPDGQLPWAFFSSSWLTNVDQMKDLEGSVVL